MRTFFIVVYEVIGGKVQGWPVNVAQAETEQPIKFFDQEGNEMLNLANPDPKEMDT